MKIFSIGTGVLLFTASILQAQSIGMSYVTVANSGNAADPATGSLYGSVGYTYYISAYDVTDSQYCTFLNAVDPTGGNALGLYDSSATDAEYGIAYTSAGGNGTHFSIKTGYGNMPVVDVDFWDTLRFANYLDDGNTETGAYTLLGGNTDGLGTPSNASALLASPQHNAGATVWLPTQNEWYKAAFYNPATGLYSTYATQSNTAPGNIIGSGSKQANYYTGSGYSVTQSSSNNSSQNYLTPVGTFTGSPSYYGTYDQSGDVFNWSSTVVSSQNLAISGGDWASGSTGGAAHYLSSSGLDHTVPTTESPLVGFRVASSIPEPSTWAIVMAGMGSLAAFRRRRGFPSIKYFHSHRPAIIPFTKATPRARLVE